MKPSPIKGPSPSIAVAAWWSSAMELEEETCHFLKPYNI